MELDSPPAGRWYTMREVVRETGIPAPTLRAWERRYGVPRPRRSSGRQRLFSGRDLEMLRWLIARQTEGMSIATAVAAWRQVAPSFAAPAAGSNAAGRAEGQALDGLRSDWIHACLAYDRGLAQSVLAKAFSLYPAEEVCSRVLQEGLSEMGELWSRGTASVQQEHFASALAIHYVERLMAAVPSPWRPERILLACPPGELHSFPLRFLALLLRQRGFDTVYLGENVPLNQVDATVAMTRPDLAVLAAQTDRTAEALIRMATLLDNLGIPVGYGGLAFNIDPALRAWVHGHFLGERLPGAAQVIDDLVTPASPGLAARGAIVDRPASHKQSA